MNEHDLKLLALDIRDSFANQATRIRDLLQHVFGESVHNDAILDEATCGVGKCARAEAAEGVVLLLVEGVLTKPVCNQSLACKNCPRWTRAEKHGAQGLCLSEKTLDGLDGAAALGLETKTEGGEIDG